MKKKIVFSGILILLILLLSTMVFADPITDSMKGINPSTGNSAIITSGQKILGIVQAVGISTAVIMMVVISIRFMIASAEGKAQIKEQMVPFVIGAILIFGVSILPYFVFVVGEAINRSNNIADASSVIDSIYA